MTTEEKHCPVCGRINLTSDEVCGFCKPQAPSPPPSPKASQLTFWQTVVVLLLGCAVILAAIFFQMPPGENRTEVMKVACGVCLGVSILGLLGWLAGTEAGRKISQFSIWGVLNRFATFLAYLAGLWAIFYIIRHWSSTK